MLFDCWNRNPSHRPMIGSLKGSFLKVSHQPKIIFQNNICCYNVLLLQCSRFHGNMNDKKENYCSFFVLHVHVLHIYLKSKTSQLNDQYALNISQKWLTTSILNVHILGLREISRAIKIDFINLLLMFQKSRSANSCATTDVN